MIKISIIGAGRVGATAALVLTLRGLCDEIVLIDILKDRAAGEALDLRHSTGSFPRKVKVRGSDDFELVEGSDITIVTAGVPRKPGQSRLDLAKDNALIIKDIVQKVKDKTDLLLMVSNPVDVLTYLARQVSGLGNKVFGLGTTLDSLRWRALLADEFGTEASKVSALVIGEHGDTMVPLLSSVKMDVRADAPRLKKVAELVRGSGLEVIKLKGGTAFAPAMAIVQVVESAIKDEQRVLPVSVYLPDLDVCIGYPAKVGKAGAFPEKISLSEEENKAFLHSVNTLKKAIKELS